MTKSDLIITANKILETIPKATQLRRTWSYYKTGNFIPKHQHVKGREFEKISVLVVIDEPCCIYAHSTGTLYQFLAIPDIGTIHKFAADIKADRLVRLYYQPYYHELNYHSGKWYHCPKKSIDDYEKIGYEPLIYSGLDVII